MSNTKWLLYPLKNWLFVLDIFFLVQIVPLYNNWSGWWESNPRSQLGRLKFYHWTTPALNGAQGRSRTGTDFKVRRILSPVRLPISPPGHSLMEVPTGLEPMMTELQSVALPTWPRNHSFVLLRVSYHAAPLLYVNFFYFAIVFYHFLLICF